MALTTEIFSFGPNDAYQDNPEILFPALDIALKAQGSHAPVYYGKQIDNSRTYVFLDWDSYEAHAALINSASYKAIVETVTACTSDPVTEVLVLTLKAPENRAAVVKILSKISEGSEGKIAFGETREDENKYFVIGRWQTVEEHLGAVAAASLDELYSLANKDHLCHVNLSQYRL